MAKNDDGNPTEARPSPHPREADVPATERDEENTVGGEGSCNLPGCAIDDDLTRGLCPAHWSTHRGLADPEPTEPKEFVAEDHPEVSMP